MLSAFDYYWFMNYDQSDILLLDESINWDDATTYGVAPYLPFLSFSSSTFNNSHMNTNWIAAFSIIEVISNSKILTTFFPKTLFVAIFLDLMILINTKYSTFVMFMFHSDYQDWMTNIFYNAPELSFALSDWLTTTKYADQIEDSARSLFDSYQDVLHMTLSEFVESLLLIVVYLWVNVIVMKGLRLRTISQSIDPYVARIYFYLFSYACETRLQLDAVYEAFVLTILFFTMMIVTFDDDREEIIEFLSLTLFYVFLTTFIVHMWRYSIHYLSFLDSSRKGTSSVFFIFGQFLFDLLNLIGFSVRFILLMLRLNIYDGIDDILDSYYVLFIDFDEEEYFADTFPDFSSFSYFDTDVQDDRSFFLEDENDLTIDLYVLYTLMWGKYTLFLAFFLEEIARVGLALFVTLLLMLEINAVNRSYDEDSYHLHKMN